MQLYPDTASSTRTNFLGTSEMVKRQHWNRNGGESEEEMSKKERKWLDTVGTVSQTVFKTNSCSSSIMSLTMLETYKYSLKHTHIDTHNVLSAMLKAKCYIIAYKFKIDFPTEKRTIENWFSICIIQRLIIHNSTHAHMHRESGGIYFNLW